MKLLTLLVLFSSFVFSQTSSIESLEKVLFEKDNDDVRTDVVIVQKEGQVIYERYARGYNADTKHLSWSMAKTFAGILIGQAQKDGYLNLQDKVSNYYKEFQGEATILDLLQMSSGIDFIEEYSGVPVHVDVTKMLYLNGPKAGFDNFTVTRELREDLKPGEYFFYSSGDSNVLMGILKKAINQKSVYDNYPWKSLFSPLGVTATFEQDSHGTFVGSSYIYMSGKDYLKVGELLVNKGELNGEQVIPQEYFSLMTQVSLGVNQYADALTSQTRAYSVQVTTNQPIEGRNLPPEYEDLPSDSLILIGHQGQLLIASPSQKLVIVRLATDSGSSFKRREFLKHIKSLADEKGVPYESAKEENSLWYSQEAPAPILAKEEAAPTAGFWDYFKVPRLIESLTAKEMCSCVFVVGRSKKTCKKDLQTSVPLKFFVDINREKKTVSSFIIPGVVEKAQYRGEKLGCALVF